MKSNFENRKENRINYAKQQAAKNKQKSEQLLKTANEMAAVIPFGQPIMIGHHSEKADRNFRSKIHNTFGNAFKAQDKAEYYLDKAKTIENNTAIFSDDPEAIQKLKARLQDLQELQDFMKEANRCIKKSDKVSFLKLKNATEDLWEELIHPIAPYRPGYESFTLQNNNANITRIKKRIVQLEKAAARPARERDINGIRLVENTQANRVQLRFEGKPSGEIRTQLKKNGFRWSPSEMAWQRQLSAWAVKVAEDIISKI